MAYITKSEQKPFTLWDFTTKEQGKNFNFSLCSTDNICRHCNIEITDCCCTKEGVSILTIIVWDNSHAFGRYEISIDKVTNEINMKELLIEIANTFGKKDYTDKECYISVNNGIKF